MATKVQTPEVYEELASWYDGQGQAKLRDWFLVLAADAAMSSGQLDQAERLREYLLHVSPHHMLRQFSSLARSLESQDVQGYIADLRRNYPLERAEQLLRSARTKRVGAAVVVEPEKKSPTPRQEQRDLKVFRVKPTNKKTAPLSAPKSPVSSAKMASTAVRARTNGAVGALRTNTLAAAPSPRVKYQEEATSFDFWVSTVLFVLALLASAGVAVLLVVGAFLAP